MTIAEIARRRKEAASYPFDQVEYIATCPEGHEIELGTSYSVHSPSSWKQSGYCRQCTKSYHRLVVRKLKPERFVCSKLKESIDTLDFNAHYEFDDK